MRTGDVIVVDFGIPAGSEAGFVRPAVVVTADAFLARSPRTFQVVPLTTTRRGYSFDVPVVASGLARDSVAQCHLVQTVAVEQVVRDGLGNVGSADLHAVREVLADLFDVGGPG